jgi:hypothetical protein
VGAGAEPLYAPQHGRPSEPFATGVLDDRFEQWPTFEAIRLPDEDAEQFPFSLELHLDQPPKHHTDVNSNKTDGETPECVRSRKCE